MPRRPMVTKFRRKTAFIKFRIDPEAKQQLQTMAGESGLTVSALMYCSAKHIIRRQEITFALTADAITMTEIEKRARIQRLKDYHDLDNLKLLDVYDG